MTCVECDTPKVVGRGLCSRHWQRHKRVGTLHLFPKLPPIEFWSRVNKTDTCWLWTAAISLQGYGMFSRACAHRVAYELLVGPIPTGLQIDHLCRVRHCVNPEHLEPVTQAENIRRGESVPGRRGRQTHCKRGHEFTEGNTYLSSRGHRTCRTCVKHRNAARYAK